MNSYSHSNSLCSVLVTALLVLATKSCFADTSATDSLSLELQNSFKTSVGSFLEEHCLDCHGRDEPEATLDLTHFQSAAQIEREISTWQLVASRVAAGEMPPQDSGQLPTDGQRDEFLAWSQKLRNHLAQRDNGDPGDVLARRLSAAEYNYTIHDITGVDIRPADQFPVDPSNKAGFDNSGESLMMTPALLNKYLEAARFVSEHVVFAPDGIRFAEHPVITDTDRDKYCVHRIVDFYELQNTDVADYLYAAWHVQNNITAKTDLQQSLSDTATSQKLSLKYLRTIWQLLQSSDYRVGPIAELRSAFRKLPVDEDKVESACQELATWVQDTREKVAFSFPHLQARGINQGSQSLVSWRNRQMASHRMKFNRELLSELVADVQQEDEQIRRQFAASYEEFCRVFPDAFYVDRRGRDYRDREQEELKREAQVRLLSAGFHSMMGYFRDDQPLYELLLNERQQRQLDQLWFELDYIANAPARQHAGFVWFERAESGFLGDPEFDPFRSADNSITKEQMIQRLRDVYIAKALRMNVSEDVLQAIEEQFTRTNANIRRVEAAVEAAKRAQIEMLPIFAARAFRRRLSPDERLDLFTFYDYLVNSDGLPHDEAMRDVVVSILMSPHFCYRLHASESSDRIHPLSDIQLASRLSYFLWSGPPDEELLALAEAGQLSAPRVLKSQARRLIADPKSRRFATEFFGNWLGFRRFESHNGVDRTRFPSFDNELRSAMFAEPVHFTHDLLQRNASVLELLYARHTFVNHTLARHYGAPQPTGADWRRLDDADQFGRGGLLPMAVFLTKNSPGLRTSPVQRGAWVVRDLLGAHIPAPPPNVPELPDDEADLGDFTLREVLAKHREHQSCSVCHAKFDSIGVVFEGFGPTGEQRRRDLGGRAVDTTARFPDGTERTGLGGLQDYLRAERENEFVETMCRKILSYGLGRSLIIADDVLLDKMQRNLKEHDFRFMSLIDDVVLSPQFLRQRGAQFHAASD